MQTAFEAFGGLDYAVNGAAIEIEAAPLADCNEEPFDLPSVFLCSSHEIKAMLAQGSGGAIVNIASTNSLRPQPNQAGCTATRPAVLGLTRPRRWTTPRPVSETTVCPGAIETPMLLGAIEARGRGPREVAGGHGLLGLLGRPDEITEVMMWLCFDAAKLRRRTRARRRRCHLALSPEP